MPKMRKILRQKLCCDFGKDLKDIYMLEQLTKLQYPHLQ